MLELSKYTLILLTVFLAVWGACHDYKTDGRMNKKGYTAIGCLVFLCLISLLVEFLSSRRNVRENEVASLQLKKENDQRGVLLLRLKKVEERIVSNISYLESLKKEISSNNREAKSIQNAIREATDVHIEQQKEIDLEIKRFSEKAELELKRLSVPLKELYLSSSLKFVSLEKLYPGYYEYLTSNLYSREVGYITSKNFTLNYFDYFELDQFPPGDIELAIYKYEKKQILDNETLSNLEPELLLSTVKTKVSNDFDGMYPNLEGMNSYLGDGSIINSRYLEPLAIKKSNGTITSILDLTTLAQQGDYAVLSFETTYPGTVELTSLILHIDKSYYSGISLDNCELIYKRSGGFRIVLEEGSEKKSSRYKYSCKLWKASELKY